MRSAAQGLADVLGEGADVRAFAAFDIEARLVPSEALQVEAPDRDAARRPLDGLPAARVRVQGDAVMLDRGMHRRRLLDFAAEALQHRAQPAFGHRHGRA
jgi:hypothetical protein